MESDLKLTLIRAAESNNEIEVKRLLDGGVDVNETDDQGKTALFYAAQNDNESIAVLLFEAGADVDAKDIEDKTALFYAAANKSIEDVCGILVALVEKGESLVNETDIYGRTPLFYAITNSIPFTRYLLDHQANLHEQDNCNVSILTCLIENCLMRQQSSATNPTFLFEVLSLLLEKGLERQSIVQSILNLVFCKAPLLFCSNENETAIPGLLKIRTDDILNALTVAVEYVDESCSAKKELILKVEEKIRSGEIFAALDLLSKMRTSSNSTDSAGNTALHYTTVLPLMGVPQESVMKMCKFLRKKGVHFSKPNHQSQTPLLFCLSANNWKMTSPSNHGSRIKTLVEVCTLLLKNGSKLGETLQSKETVFHLMMKLFQLVFNIHDKVVRKNVLHELMKLLEVFAVKGEKQRKIGNKHDDSGNSPLHLWATLILPSSQDYSSNICENYTFEKVLELILDSLLKCGANVNGRNNENETPLHLCKTWTAVKLLLDAEANPNDVDSSGRSPLLVAARNKTFLKHPDRFYPDFTDDPKAFWRSALDKGLDPWTPDKKDGCVLSVLLELESFLLARDLVEAACDEKQGKTDIKMSLLVAICKDRSRQTRGKSILAKTILESRKKIPFPIHEALLCCCRNIKEFGVFDEEADGAKPLQAKEEEESNKTVDRISKEQDRKTTDRAFDSVHCKIAKLLLSSGADINVRNSSGESCLDLAENCPALRDLLTKFKTVDVDAVSIIPWTSASKRYKNILDNVTKQQECDFSLGSYWYHKNSIKSGKFGEIFAGICVNDGREVAIKRIEKLRIKKLQRPRDTREVTSLTALADCQQVVRYLYFINNEHFSYVVLELMEGNLEEYFTETFDPNQSIHLCQEVVMGVEYLHKQNILHRDLKPGNILYKVHPELCLKIADFGLSRRIDSSGSNTVYSINSGTKCWIAPEVLSSSVDDYQHSKSSDMFSCGLVLHYILSVRKHPFSPADCANKGESQAVIETETNIKNGRMEGLDNTLTPEATHLLTDMLGRDVNRRPSAEGALEHPLFWSNKKKIDFLEAVGNQKEFEYSRSKRNPPLTPVEIDLENSFSTIVTHGNWSGSRYKHMPNIYTGMITGKGRKSYDTSSAVELVRFIRNVYEHYREKTFVFATPITTVTPVTTKQMLFEDFVFLENFPNLVMEIYKAVTTHGWDQKRDDISFAMTTK